MTTRIGINGFGRIGRQSLKAILERHPDELEVVAVNDLADDETNAYLFKYDSTYGPLRTSATTTTRSLSTARDPVFSERDPAELPWSDLGVDIVIESTGIFTDATKASATATPVAKVIIWAPAKNEDVTIVLGVNDDDPGAAPHRQQRQLHDERASPPRRR